MWVSSHGPFRPQQKIQDQDTCIVLLWGLWYHARVQAYTVTCWSYLDTITAILQEVSPFPSCVYSKHHFWLVADYWHQQQVHQLLELVVACWSMALHHYHTLLVCLQLELQGLARKLEPEIQWKLIIEKPLGAWIPYTKLDSRSRKLSF